MSDEKNRAEAHRWLQTARGDLETARVLADHDRWAHACFHSQQAAEKALKAVWYSRDGDPWGHSVLQLIDDLGELDRETHAQLRDLREAAARLDRYYVPTRYPNGLPDITPDQAFFASDAASALDAADTVLSRASHLIA